MKKARYRYKTVGPEVIAAEVYGSILTCKIYDSTDRLLTISDCLIEIEISAWSVFIATIIIELLKITFGWVDSIRSRWTLLSQHCQPSYNLKWVLGVVRNGHQKFGFGQLWCWLHLSALSSAHRTDAPVSTVAIGGWRFIQTHSPRFQMTWRTT